MPRSTTPKLSAFSAIVKLVKENLSPQKKGRGHYAGLYDTPQEPVSQLPWNEGMLRAFEACATEIAHPSIAAKKDQLSLWMGLYLKPGKSSHTKDIL